MYINLERKFKKQYRKADAKIQRAFDKRLKLFIKSPFNPQLNNHQLTGKFKDYRSINVTGDWRAIFRQDKDTFVFEFLGTHSQLYK